MKLNIKKIINYEFKEKNINKNKALKILVYLLIAIVGFTLLSRFSDSLTVPRVSTATATYEPFVKSISAFGEITESREENITTVKEVLVEYVNVSSGTTVKEGDILFKLSKDSLNSKITETQKAIDEKNKIYNRAIEDYNNEKKEIENQINDEYNTMTELNNRYEIEENFEEKEILRQQYEESKEKYNSLVNSKDETLLLAKRNVEDSNSTDEVRELNEFLTKLKDALASDGVVVCNKNAYITNVFIEAGSTTTEGVAITLADESSDYKFKATVSKNDKKYLHENQEVLLKLSNSYEEVTGLNIESIALNKEDRTQYDVVVNVPAGQASIGESAELNLVESEEKTRFCIPKDAINMGEKNSYYIWIMEEKETALGSDTVAVKREIKIKDQNDKYVVIDDNVIGMKEEIIISSNKTISEGERVRKGKN